MSDKSKLWYLENFNLFKELQMPEMEVLSNMTTIHEFNKSEPIYFAREPSNEIFFLKKGRVKIARVSPAGKELILAIINPGEVFGELSIADENERTDFATAMDNSLICSINKDEFKGFLEKNPVLNLKITKLIGFRLMKHSERLEELVFKDASQRVASFILRFAAERGKKIGEQIFVRPSLTHQDIAKLTACSRQTVNATLTELREKGIIRFDRRKIIIDREDELRNFHS